MTYNIYFELCSLIYLSIITIYFFVKKKYLNRQGKIYAFYILFVFLDITTNMLTIYMIDKANIIPLFYNNLANSLYMLCQFIMPSILYLYIISSSRTIKNSAVLLTMLPLALGIVAVLINPFVHNLFYFDQYNNYIQGSGQWQLYLNGAFYIIATLVYTIKHYYKLGKQYCYTIVAIVAIMIFGLILQFINPDLLVTGTGAVISLFMLYLIVENPDNYSDNITTCLNRTAMISLLEELYFKNNSRDITIISLEDFKTINDIFGINTGDLLLKEIGEYLQSISKKDTVFRINGDIFVIISAPGKNLSKLILKRFKDEFKINNFSINLCVCISTLTLQHYKSHQEVIQMIDYSIQSMKSNRDNQIHFIDNSAKQALLRKNAIILETKHIFENQQLEIFYQPLYDSKSNNISSLEALVRFKTKEYGYIPAEEFISICEQNGSIIEIGKLVIIKVCQFYNSNRNLFPPDFKIAINLSVIQLTQANFFDEAINIIKKYNIKSNQIIFEITESSTLYSHSVLMKNVHALANYGFSLAMDDYGTGYASINNMITLPISIVKIDKSVVWAAMDDHKARIILENTISMLLALDFKIVCEGIETIEQINNMTALGVQYLQGYYFSKPVNENKILSLLNRTSN